MRHDTHRISKARRTTMYLIHPNLDITSNADVLELHFRTVPVNLPNLSHGPVSTEPPFWSTNFPFEGCLGPWNQHHAAPLKVIHSESHQSDSINCQKRQPEVKASQGPAHTLTTPGVFGAPAAATVIARKLVTPINVPTDPTVSPNRW